MNDIQILTHPVILDSEALLEFSEALVERAHEIERNMAKLSKAPENRVLIADIFRALHNIKGDAALCRVPMAGLIAHPLESLLTRLRSAEVSYTPLFGEIVLLTLDRLELAVEALVASRPVVQLKLVELVAGLEKISEAPQHDLDRLAATLIKTVTGFQPQASLQYAIAKPSALANPAKESMAEDLKFFRSLALQFETRSPLFAGRTERLRQLALDTNRKSGSPVDEVQLEAALYLHDIGMMFLPESVWLKVERMSDEERAVLRSHPSFATGLLERMENWQAAAEMVQQHHETWDGKGYPLGLKGAGICSGAKLIAIVDAFEAVMLKHSARGHGSSVLRAVAEVNACDKQFAPEWIEPFNTIIRTMLER
ncbi:MAG: HD domain-containing phosphohydrolase [Gallionellaceae bacterium]